MPCLIRPKPNSWVEEKINTNRDALVSIPTEVLIIILEYISAIDACNFMLVDQHAKELLESSRIWINQHGTIQSPMHSLHRAWVIQFNSYPFRFKESYFTLNSALDIFSDDTISSMDKPSINELMATAVQMSKKGLWKPAKRDIDAATEIARHHGSTLPESGCIRVEEACVEQVVQLLEHGYWENANRGMATAAEIAGLHGSTLPKGAYIRAGEACIKGTIRLCTRGYWNCATEGINAASWIARLHDLTLPETTYICFQEACIEGAVRSAAQGFRNLPKQCIIAACEISKLYGSTFPHLVYIHNKVGCTNKEAAQFSKDDFWNVLKGCIPAGPEILRIHGLTETSHSHIQEACINEAVQLLDGGLVVAAKVAIAAACEIAGLHGSALEKRFI